jgi:hypothetical protein
MFFKLIRYLGIQLKRLKGFRTFKHIPVNLDKIEKWPIIIECKGRGYFNEIEVESKMSLEKHQVFPMDNYLTTNLTLKNKKKILTPEPIFEDKPLYNHSHFIKNFIEMAQIPSGWRYSGLYYAGFSLEKKQYIMPSWLWINGKIVHYLIESDQSEKAIALADRLLSLQLTSGGWIVRYDYKNCDAGVCPVIAPNDSAHCSDHGLLSAYKVSGDRKYLHAAEKCASWIMTEGQDNGLILYGYNLESKKWELNQNIVDIGFSSSLFCSLYYYTENKDYLNFAKKFLTSYIRIFYRGNGIFYSSTWNNRPTGKGIFARGLAWALEGMIPYYELTNDHFIGNIIDDTVCFLIKHQHHQGGWLYNLRPGPVGLFSGFDNKGTPVIANSLSRWKKSRPDKSKIIDDSVRLSIKWCIEHIKHTPPGAGGIFSSNFEGGVVHSPNTEVAFVYSNCYLYDLINTYNMDSTI